VAGARLPPRRASSRPLSRRSDMAAFSPWQAMQRCCRIAEALAASGSVEAAWAASANRPQGSIFQGMRMATYQDYQSGTSKHTAAESVAHGLGFRMHVQLLIDASNVVTDCVYADVDAVCRCLVTVAFSQQTQHTDFLRGQVRRLGRRRGFLKHCDDLTRDLR